MLYYPAEPLDVYSSYRPPIPPRFKHVISVSALFHHSFRLAILSLGLNFFATACYQPCARPKYPSYGPNNVFCYIPSVECSGIEFQRTLQSAIDTGCRMVYISTIHSAMKNARDACNRFSTAVRVLVSEERPNKRVQICVAVQQIARDIKTRDGPASRTQTASSPSSVWTTTSGWKMPRSSWPIPSHRSRIPRSGA